MVYKPLLLPAAAQGRQPSFSSSSWKPGESKGPREKCVFSASGFRPQRLPPPTQGHLHFPDCYDINMPIHLTESLRNSSPMKSTSLEPKLLIGNFSAHVFPLRSTYRGIYEKRFLCQVFCVNHCVLVEFTW
jgi:hypothetical protein